MSDEEKKAEQSPEKEPPQKGAAAGAAPEPSATAEEAKAAAKKTPAAAPSGESKPKPAARAAAKATDEDEQAESAASGPALHVAPSPHVVDVGLTTRGLMLDVVLALSLPVAAAFWYFRWHAVFVLALTTASCMAFEWLFMKLRGREATLGDLSAVVTGIILALSLPWSTPWWICVVASMVAIGVGKVVFGSLGQNIFNPAMVGRAFVMISFSAYLGAGAYVDAKAGVESILSQATPMTAALSGVPAPSLWSLFMGNTNGSLGETSALASILGGLYLLIRRTASWEVPLGMVLALVVLAGGTQLLVGPTSLPALKVTLLQHLLSGAFLFGAFFIATDPVTNPITAKGKFWFGVGVSFFVWLLRVFSNYPEGLMFAVLLMNAVVPLINRWTVPLPFGGPVPERK